MPGDGVSMPTVLSQLGNVAKAQAQGQKAAGSTAGTLANHEKEELQALKKVQELPKAGKQSLQADRDARRGPGGGGKRDAEQEEQEASGRNQEDEDIDADGREPGLGVLVDRKA